MKVFISSTYLDLIEHRKAAVNSLRAMGEEVDHMEIFGARDEEPTKASLDELDKPESKDISIDLNYLAGAEHASKDYPAAERDYREALRIDNNNQEGIAIRTGNLAALALDRKQWAEAESLAREALALAEKVGRQELIAGDCHRLAKALLKQNKNLDEALPLSRRAVEIFTRLRSQSLQSAQETLAEIEKAPGGR